VNFRVFAQKELGKHNKQNKTTAKSVGHGIANSITDKEAQALFVAELANSIQEQSQKQFKEMMELFKAKLDAKSSPYPSNQEQNQKQFKEMMELFKAKLDAKSSPYPSNPKGGEGKKQKKMCQHCGMEM
jgi:hypothetical protein